MPIAILDRSKLLQQHRAKVRDDLSLGELATALQGLRRQTLIASQPFPQIIRYRQTRRLNRGPGIDFGEKPRQFGLGCFFSSLEGHITGLALPVTGSGSPASYLRRHLDAPRLVILPRAISYSPLGRASKRRNHAFYRNLSGEEFSAERSGSWVKRRKRLWLRWPA